MHERRMIAEVVPPGCCAIVNVSGSRIATPFAPPSPGSTPMMMPRTTPTNISSRLNGDSATPNPCSSALISSTWPPFPGVSWVTLPAARSIEAQRGLERPLGKRYREPNFENQEKRDADAYCDGCDLDPSVFSEPPHEVRDVYRGGDIEAQERDQRYVDHRRHEDRENHLQLLARHKRFRGERGVSQRAHEDRRAREANQQPDVEGEVAGLRSVISPSGTDTIAVEHDDGTEQEYDHGDTDFHRPYRCGRLLFLFFHTPPPDARLLCDLVGEEPGLFHEHDVPRLFASHPGLVVFPVQGGLVECALRS